MEQAFQFLTADTNPDYESNWLEFQKILTEAVLLVMQYNRILDPFQHQKVLQYLPRSICLV